MPAPSRSLGSDLLCEAIPGCFARQDYRDIGIVFTPPGGCQQWPLPRGGGMAPCDVRPRAFGGARHRRPGSVHAAPNEGPSRRHPGRSLKVSDRHSERMSVSVVSCPVCNSSILRGELRIEILAAGDAGYSPLMADETGTYSEFRSCHEHVLEPGLSKH